MIERRDAFYDWEDRSSGFTLAEVLIVTAMISILAAVSIPAMIGFVRKTRENSYVAESYLVRAALESYLIEKSGIVPISDEEIYEKILYPQIDEKANALYPMLAGCCSKGGKIIGVGYNKVTYEVVDLVYCADGYEVEIKKGNDVRVEKVK